MIGAINADNPVLIFRRPFLPESTVEEGTSDESKTEFPLPKTETKHGDKPWPIRVLMWLCFTHVILIRFYPIFHDASHHPSGLAELG